MSRAFHSFSYWLSLSLSFSIDLPSSFFNIELSEYHVGGLGDLFRIHCVADLVRMLVDQCHAVLLQLLERLWLALGSTAAATGIVLNEWLEAEFYRDGHKIRVLCYIFAAIHALQQLLLFFLLEFYWSSLFNPDYLFSCSLVHLDKGSTCDEQLVLECVPQVNCPASILVLEDRISWVIDTFKALHECHQKDRVSIVLSLVLELCWRDDTLDDILREAIKVRANIEQPRHDLSFRVELQRDALQVRLCDIVDVSDSILELFDLGYFFIDLTQRGNYIPDELWVDLPVGHTLNTAMRREIVDSLPFIRPWTDLGGLHMTEQFFIPVGHGWESDIWTRLDHGLCLRIQHHLAVYAVTHAQLLTEDDKCAVLAVSEEHAWLIWTQHDLAILTPIDVCLRHVVVQVQLSPIRLLHLESWSI